MPTAVIEFTHLMQDSQDFGSDDDHMVSRAFFAVQLEGRVFPNCYVDVKQTVGSSFQTAPLEVSAPRGYDGPMNHEALRAAAERYYRRLVGGPGAMFGIAAATNVRMRNNLFQVRQVETIEVRNDGRSW